MLRDFRDGLYEIILAGKNPLTASAAVSTDTSGTPKEGSLYQFESLVDLVNSIESVMASLRSKIGLREDLLPARRARQSSATLIRKYLNPNARTLLSRELHHDWNGGVNQFVHSVVERDARIRGTRARSAAVRKRPVL